LVLGRRPLGTILHSSNEPGELSQWLCHDDSTINIVVLIIIIIWRPLKISPPKLEKPTYGTQLYRYANFHADRHKISVPGQKYIFFLIGDSPGVTIPRYTFLESSNWANVTSHMTCNAVTYHFQDIHGQNLGFWEFLAVPPKGRRPVWNPYLQSCKIWSQLVALSPRYVPGHIHIKN